MILVLADAFSHSSFDLPLRETATYLSLRKVCHKKSNMSPTRPSSGTQKNPQGQRKFGWNKWLVYVIVFSEDAPSSGDAETGTAGRQGPPHLLDFVGLPKYHYAIVVPTSSFSESPATTNSAPANSSGPSTEMSESVPARFVTYDFPCAYGQGLWAKDWQHQRPEDAVSMAMQKTLINTTVQTIDLMSTKRFPIACAVVGRVPLMPDGQPASVVGEVGNIVANEPEVVSSIAIEASAPSSVRSGEWFLLAMKALSQCGIVDIDYSEIPFDML